jgi:hypothetical protein
VGTRIAGILLFLPVPAVLFLFTRMPLGVVPSIVAGLALMMTHPLYARPWALRQASGRCLWCGGPVAGGAGASASTALAVTDPRGSVNWGACGEEHRASLVAMLRIAARHGALLRVGILGTVTVSLIAAALADRGWLGPFRVSDASALFRLGVGLTVLPLGWLGPRLREGSGATVTPIEPTDPGRGRTGPADLGPDPGRTGRASPGCGGTKSADTLSAPFPLHLAALIGVNAVLWLFRLVGLIWLVQGAFHVIERVSRG